MPKALERYLSTKENIQMLKGAAISGLQMTEDGRIEVCFFLCIEMPVLIKCMQVILDSPAVPRIVATHVVSALPLPVLHNILSPAPVSHHLPGLNVNPTSTVTVVNLVFPTSPYNIHPEGFGYLVPRRPDQPGTKSQANDLPIIGTIFDSCSLSAQDDDPAAFTKMTVMIKGDYPLSSASTASSSSSTVPDMILRILSALSTHLSRSLPDPVFWRVRVNRSCIPTYTLGHRQRMREVTKKVKDAWKGRLEVVGSGLGGASVGDCVKAGRNVGQGWLSAARFKCD